MEPRAAAPAAQPHGLARAPARRRIGHGDGGRRWPLAWQTHPFARDLAAQRGEPRAAVAGRVPRAQRAASTRTRSRSGTARLAFTYRRVRRALPPARLGARAARHRPRRHGRGHGAQRAGDARGALRGAGARRRAERAQLPARCRGDRVLPRARRGEGPDHRRRVRAGDARRRSRSSAAAAPGRRHRRSAKGPGGERLGAVDYEALLAEGDPGFAWPGPPTSGTRWRCSTRRARPAIPRASSTTIAARTSTRSATRSPSG